MIGLPHPSHRMAKTEWKSGHFIEFCTRCSEQEFSVLGELCKNPITLKELRENVLDEVLEYRSDRESYGATHFGWRNHYSLEGIEKALDELILFLQPK